jgi:hypothetical protein
MVLKNKLAMKRRLKNVTQDLAELNLELASQMVLLASQTGDTDPLIQAVKALRQAEDIYTLQSMPQGNLEVQQALGDTLLTLGRAQNDIKALMSAADAYRAAITLASMVGDHKLRRALKRNLGHADALRQNLQGRQAA